MRKRRTREHIIEDLGFNYIERQVLLNGCTVQKIVDDYGYDGLIHTFNQDGEYENALIKFQLKSTDYIKQSPSGFAFDLSKKDLELWLTSYLPVLLFLYDAQNEVAYYVNLRNYFQENSIVLKNVRKYVRVYLPATNKLDPMAMRLLIEEKKFG